MQRVEIQGFSRFREGFGGHLECKASGLETTESFRGYC